MEEELRQSEEADRRKKEEVERQKALAAAPPTPQLDAPATPESTALSPESPAESPYPSESTVPDLAAEGTRPEESIEDTTASAVEAARLRIEPNIEPRILPPSTGEVVAANPPGRLPQQAELFETPSEPAAPVPANDNVSGANEAANDANRSEQATHHG
jgi:hypothetical protein